MLVKSKDIDTMNRQNQLGSLPQRIESQSDSVRVDTEATQAAAALFREYQIASAEKIETSSEPGFETNGKFWLKNRLMPEEELVKHAKSVAEKLDKGQKFEAAKEYDEFQQKLDRRNFITFNQLIEKYDKKTVGYDFSVSKFSKAYFLKQPTR
jgi:hypothetical protein